LLNKSEPQIDINGDIQFEKGLKEALVVGKTDSEGSNHPAFIGMELIDTKEFI